MEFNSLFTDDYNRLQTVPKKGGIACDVFIFIN